MNYNKNIKLIAMIVIIAVLFSAFAYSYSVLENKSEKQTEKIIALNSIINDLKIDIKSQDVEYEKLMGWYNDLSKKHMDFETLERKIDSEKNQDDHMDKEQIDKIDMILNILEE